MPNTKYALITWIPFSNDGSREARKLNALYQNYSDIISLDMLTTSKLSDYLSLIVVGHRGEFSHNYYESLMKIVRGSQCTWVVLANCNSGKAKHSGPLGDNELISPAQKLSNSLGIEVSGTVRQLTFDEVGEGLAFALAVGEILIRSNPPGNFQLWRDYVPQSDIEEATEMFSKL